MAIESIIKMPTIVQEGPASNSPGIQKDVVTEVSGLTSGTAGFWFPNAFCYTSGTGASVVLNQCASAATLVYGQSPDGAKGSATPAALLKPPFALFGLTHYCFDPRDRVFEVNISNATANQNSLMGTTAGVTWAGGGTGGVALAAGSVCNLLTSTAGTYLNYQFANVATTAQPFFTVVALAPGRLTTDNSARIYAKVNPSYIQG
jgi:hypothetical protein